MTRLEGKPKILIVDDRPENLVTLKRVLGDLDVELVEATNGNDALKATLYHDFALALLDIQMPEMDGYELASILREEEKTANLPFVFISAVYTDNLNVFKGYEKGAFSFITKPFQPEILVNKVKFFIEKHQQEVALYRLNEDLKKKNEDLERMNQELEAFSYSVSHDLRSPLRSINGYASILKEEFEGNLEDEAQRLLNKIIRSALKMSNLIDSLLSLSRLGRNPASNRSVNMNALVQKVLRDFEKIQDQENIEIKVEHLPVAKGDQELLRQVYVNLISNALKYSSNRDNPIIEIGSSIKDGVVVYYVKDNGAGFNMDYKDKLFGVFQRLHGAQEFEGVGIGLAIVKRIINRHGGEVWAEGKVDRGASFYFTLNQEGYGRTV
ncbi:ATP-binding protein [Salinimicrobium catena]|uniref:sensor histidine kinase n=1 Tax=Salinimicrobium catena TaxID=390640 RepID=UPI002FE4407E